MCKNNIYRNLFLELARARLQEVVGLYLDRVNRSRKKKKKKKRRMITASSLDIVGVHVRRTDHLSYEDRLGYRPLTRTYFIQVT